MEKELVLYSRGAYTPFVALARDLLKRYEIPHREINIDGNQPAQTRLQSWIAEIQIPTLALCQPGQDTLIAPPEPFNESPPLRGQDRGSLIVEPNNQQLENWLHKHGFLAKPYKR